MSRHLHQRITHLECLPLARIRREPDYTRLSPFERAELKGLRNEADRVGLATLTDAQVERGAELQSKALGVPYES